MKRALLLLTILFYSQFLMAQLKLKQASWQQEVNYEIQVSLDDNKHMLDGFISMEYINNSPNDLNEIYMHLWPNAYKNNETAFAKQFLENGSTKFHFAKDKDRGYIDSIDFKVNGNKVSWTLDDEHIDIALIKLNNPLKSGESLKISTPFRVKLPASFSRLGHEDQSYQITQWYPKPAVYDINGWNPMPYLNQGEFYSEFGSFDVSITLPENYIVAATGVLQNPEEWKRIKDREAKPIANDVETPESSSKTKTIRYIQDNVHDFAWFADKDFNVKSSSVTLPSGKVVKTYTYDPDISDKVKHVDEAVLYYSKNVGEYPYDYCSAVRGQLKAGGGMEYPMVTIISSFDQEVIVHEVGHNWFYGILGSNERRYPWMDESINSYIEWETLQDSKNALEHEEILEPRTGIAQNLENINDYAMELLAFQAERTHTHQAVNCHSKDLTGINYGIIVYGKGSIVFKHLKAYLGDDQFDICFHNYFNDWKFKHPLPGDIKSSFEKSCGEDLSWFFDDLIGSEKIMDFELNYNPKYPKTIKIYNTGEIQAPVPVTFAKNGLAVETIWIAPFPKVFELEIPQDKGYDQVKIDVEQVLFENNRRNNTVYLKGKKAKQFKFGIGIEDPEAKKWNYLPLIGYNIHDGAMLGLGVHNIGFPSRNLEFIAAPMYGFNSKELAGYFNVKKTNYKNSKRVYSTELGFNSSRFSFVHPSDVLSYSYQKINPYFKINFAKPHKRSRLYRSLKIDYNFQSFDPNYDVDAIKNEMVRRTNQDTIFNRTFGFEPQQNQQLVHLTYLIDNKRALNPYSLEARLQYGMGSMVRQDGEILEDDFIKLNITGNYFVNYPFQKKGLRIRGFFGTFLEDADNSIYHYRFSSEGGKWDYERDHALMGRGATEGIFEHQVVEREGFLKNSAVLPNQSAWIATLNLESGLPIKGPVGLYMDLFTYKNMKDESINNIFNTGGDKIGYTGGVMIDFGPVFKFYLPLFDSPFLTDVYKTSGNADLKDRMTFKLNMNLVNLLDLKNQLEKTNLF